MRIYKFRNCILNTFERNVLKDGKRVKLTTRTFDVLQLLVERSGETVTKDEILGEVWHGRFVEEGNLPVHIAKLRKILESTETERFIETVHGIGYRFVSPVQLVVPDEWKDEIFIPNCNMHNELNKAARILLQAARSIQRLVPEERQAETLEIGNRPL